MTSLFTLASRMLELTDIDCKLAQCQAIEQELALGTARFDALPTPLNIEAVRFPEHPRWVDPRELPKRKLTTVAGRIALLHAVAHIEFSAIHLAFDHLIRFPGLPEDYYGDWLSVALDEVRHFSAIRARLRELGADYGELPVHGGLWELAKETADDLTARMALVPRFMEARGLDVTPGMIERLQATGDHDSVGVLEMILREEVSHVAFGSRWFRWQCEQIGAAPEHTYFDLLQRHLKGMPRGPFNHALRRQAGFSDEELARLDALDS